MHGHRARLTPFDVSFLGRAAAFNPSLIINLRLRHLPAGRQSLNPSLIIKLGLKAPVLEARPLTSRAGPSERKAGPRAGRRLGRPKAGLYLFYCFPKPPPPVTQPLEPSKYEEGPTGKVSRPQARNRAGPSQPHCNLVLVQKLTHLLGPVLELTRAEAWAAPRPPIESTSIPARGAVVTAPAAGDAVRELCEATARAKNGSRTGPE